MMGEKLTGSGQSCQAEVEPAVLCLWIFLGARWADRQTDVELVQTSGAGSV